MGLSIKRRSDSGDLPHMIKIMRVVDSKPEQQSRIPTRIGTKRAQIVETPQCDIQQQDNKATWMDRLIEKHRAEPQFSCQPKISPLRESVLRSLGDGNKVKIAHMKELLGLE
uniref:Uncharacterized protein n=1 Tax=Mucochytrium quahogii TaxID=96639 RepID=A0A7S2RA24_9STRA|mmetsp:Transcript_11855/g.25476  ORF Transcript_11855/g.25476 Transcript_11855/m.25476 type:complete len:112 (+) Transcript_11855:225-560(+)